ncbi:MAG: VOC family protein [Candidatus Bathyarchaeota archaeon]|nr:VOC family protein [Candidatus Bathyarchaeota archaeon]
MMFNKLIPELSVACVDKSLEFYVGVLGFVIEYSRPEEGFCFLSLEGSQIMIEEINDNWWTGELEHPFGRGINFQIEVSDVSVLVDSLVEAGVALFRPVGERWYRGDDTEFGQIEFLVQDPDGYLLRFTQDIGERKRRE